MTKIQKLVAQINELTNYINTERESIQNSITDSDFDAAVARERTDKLEEKKKELDNYRAVYKTLSEEEQEQIADTGGNSREITPTNDSQQKTMDAHREELFRAVFMDGQVPAGNPYFKEMSQDAASLMGNYGNAGAYVANEQLIEYFIKKMDDAFPLINRGNNLVLKGAGSVSARELVGDLDDATWDDEQFSNLTEDEIQIGRRNMTPYMLTKLVKFGRTHLFNAPNFESLVSERMTLSFGRSRERAMIQGNGNKKPLGICLEDTNGITSDRIVETATSLTIGYGDLINMYTALKAAYRNRAVWVFHRDVLNDLMQLTDNADRYIWSPASVNNQIAIAGSPGTLMGIPVVDNEYMEQKTSGAWVAGDMPVILGDFTHYWHLFGQTMSMQRLTEKYAEENKIGLLAHMSVDGAPVLPEAFSVLKIKA